MPRIKTPKAVHDPRLHSSRLVTEIQMLSVNAYTQRKLDEYVPLGWHDAHDTAPCQPAKEKMTIRLDADMLWWYRSMGQGYQNRINEVLRCYMDAVLSRHVKPIADYKEAGPRE